MQIAKSKIQHTERNKPWYILVPFLSFRWVCLFRILAVLEVALKPPDCHLPFKRLLYFFLC